MRLVVFILLFASTAVAQMIPDGYTHWSDQSNPNKQKVKIGGYLEHYQSGESWSAIENDWITLDDTLHTNRNAVLQTDVNDKGQSTVTMTMGGTTYAVSQRLLKMVWINTQTHNWTDIADVTWNTPSVDSNIIKWSGIIPGVDYRVRKTNGQVEHGVFFKPAFLDSAVTLYDQRADSQFIALGNVMAYTLVNVDNADSGIGTVDRRELKRVGKYLFSLNRQSLHVGLSDSISNVPVKQRWIKQGGKIYCVEYVMMHDVKAAHEAEPSKVIWHNTDVTITGAANTKDCDLNFFAQSTNNGSDVTIFTANSTDGRKLLIDFDLTGNGVSGTIDTATLEIVMGDNVIGTSWTMTALLTDFVEAEATYDEAKSSVFWAGGGDFTLTNGNDLDSCGNSNPDPTFCDTTQASAGGGNETMKFDGTGLKNSLQNRLDGSEFGMHLSIDEGGVNRVMRAADHGTASLRPSLFVSYTVDSGVTPTRRRRILQGA